MLTGLFQLQRRKGRYVDLIMNPEVKETFRKRSQIIAEIRRILDEKGYLEVETPILNTISGGATARPFITHHNTLDIDMYLRIATELNLKRLIVGGYDKVYEMGRIFRNEGMDIRHNPEFTSIELYSAYENYHDMMDITEEIYKKCAMTDTWRATEQHGEHLRRHTRKASSRLLVYPISRSVISRALWRLLRSSLWSTRYFFTSAILR